MSIKTISALVAAAAFSTGAFAQTAYPSQPTDNTYRAQPTQQYYQGQSDGTYSGSAGTQSYSNSSDPSWTPQNGAYIEHTYQDSVGTANPYARDMKDGPMGTSPGS